MAPTDTRRRPDQRAMENGDLKTAAFEKNRLEEKQRRMRKKRETLKLDENGTSLYFTPEVNKDDGKTYWKYNNLYFEQDRIK